MKDADYEYPELLPQAKKVEKSDKDAVMDPKCFVHRDEWVSHNERASCFVCVRAFNAFRRRHSCRMCGEVVCSKCSLFKRVDVHIGENKVRICSGCYLAYRKSHETGVAIAAPVLTLPAPTEDYNGVSAAIRAAMAATETARREEGARRAAIKAKNFASEHAARLEKEVAQGKTRVEELENVVAGIKQHQGKETLSKEQEKELQDAKKMISILQHRLRTQEKMSREAAESAMEFTGDASAAKLRKKLQKMERQLIQAGLNVVEDIPYDEAKQKINSISTRMQEIGSSEVQCEDKTKQSALRKEYFELEQQMERYNTALMMTDEYINEQNDKERAWNDANEIANRNALERLRGCIPVDLCNLSEKGLLGMETPSGASLELALARRLKRTNILELLRVDPETIKRMHPSVIEGFRPNGLSIDERRALHAVLHGPYLDWKKRKVEELSNRKFMWYEKLLVTFKNALEQYTNHVAKYATDDDTAPHTCDLIGRQCPVKADGVISKLYAVDFGFPIGDVYHVKEVLKSDPDGAGEKALAEAQAHANVMVANQRSKQLKDHYGMKVRQVSQAAGFMEELDATLEAMDKAEEVWAVSFATSRDKPWTEEVESYLSAVQDMKLIVLKVGERSAMNMSGKRDATKDGKDTRAEIEIQLAIDVLAYMEASLNDIKTRIKSFAETRKYRGSLSQVEALLDLLVEIQTRNRHTCIERSTDTYIPVFKRRPWSARVPAVIAPKKVEIHRTSSAPSPSKGLPPPNPLKKALLSSIATRSKVEVGLPREDDGRKAPVDMLAAIKARKKKPSSCPNLLDLNPGGSNRNDMLLEALQNRNKTLSRRETTRQMDSNLVRRLSMRNSTLPTDGSFMSNSKRQSMMRSGSRRLTFKPGKRRFTSSLPPELIEKEKRRSAIRIQRAWKVHLAYKQVHKRIEQVYIKVYDKNKEKYYYVNKTNGERYWTTPPIMRLYRFELKYKRPIKNQDDAACRIQHMMRASRSRRLIRAKVRDVFQKHFDESTRKFYYLNTNSGEMFEEKPLCLGKEDLSIETFRHRHAVCRLTTTHNLSATGVLVSYRGIKCVLTDCTSLPTQHDAPRATVHFNFTEASEPYVVRLRPELFFMSSNTPQSFIPSDPTLDYSICGVEEADFAASGVSVIPLELSLDDRKMHCAETYQVREYLEIVGHPHAKRRCIFRTRLNTLLPNSINPKFVQYTEPMESAASGSPVFNLGGRLVGIHHQKTMKDATNEATLISAIIHNINLAALPPPPLLMTTVISHDMLNLHWEMPFGYITLNNLEFEFEMEFGKRERGVPGRFEVEYRGPFKYYTLKNLLPNMGYAVRCRAVNKLCCSAWSSTLRIKTSRIPDMSWRIKYCETTEQVVDMMEQHPDDLAINKATMRWIVGKLMDSPGDDDPFYDEIFACRGDQAVFKSLNRYLNHYDHTISCLYTIQALAANGRELRIRLATTESILNILDIMRKFRKTDEMMQWCLAVLGYFVRDYETAKCIVQVNGGIPLILGAMEQFQDDIAVIHEACYTLAMLAHNFEICKYHIGINGGLRILAVAVTQFIANPSILYWACLALGNLSCNYPGNRLRAQKYQVVEALCSCKVNYIRRKDELELLLMKQAQVLESKRIHSLGQDSVEIDQLEFELTQNQCLLDAINNENVIQAAEYALNHLMTEDHKRMRAYCKIIAHKLLFERCANAFGIWQIHTKWMRDTTIMTRFLQKFENRHIHGAFRQWELVTRHKRPKGKVKQFGQALLTKRRTKHRLTILKK